MRTSVALLIFAAATSPPTPTADTQPDRFEPAPAPVLDTAATTVDSVARLVTELADAYVSKYVAAYPEWAFMAGFPVSRHNGLSDNSLMGLRKWQSEEDALWERVSRIDADRLWGRPEWVTFGFLREVLEAARLTRVCRTELWPANQMLGWQTAFAPLAAAQPVGMAQNRTDAIERWRQLPTYLKAEISNMREGLRLGYTTPRHNVELTIQQLEDILKEPTTKSPFYSPAERDSVAEFRQAWAALLDDELNPAIRQYLRFLRREYLPKARPSIPITAHPNGAVCYRAGIRSQTSLDLSPAELRASGEKLVARNEADIVRIGSQELGEGNLNKLRARVDHDSANHFKSREELLAFTESAVARAGAVLPKWFGRIPKAPAVVKPKPEFLGNASDSYQPAAKDGSRPGLYEISLFQPQKKLRSKAEVTAFHEIYPGHHLQIALAQEQPEAHPISLLVWTGAFVEGWGRYAEILAEEMGLYTSPLTRVARRRWPGHGLVMDPGLHAFGWSRARAVEYVKEGGWPEAEALVDRAVVWPAQLTAYDTGALQILALRERAERELGERFDIREFHDRVLANGGITLPMLGKVIDRWISEKKSRT